MTKKHSTKRSLIASILVLCLCLTSFIGTTFAWFTDSVTSANNIIKSGTLDVEMYYADGTKAIPADENGWADASKGAIFNYDNWEPGYAVARHIKIANEGTLALKYAIRIIPNGDVTELADVIDVYYADPAVQVSDRAALTDDKKLGTLSDVLAGMETTASGNLAAGASDTITLVLKMQESAGNEYQNKSIGTSFSVQLVATQLMAEEDSFGKDYDEGADMPYASVPVVLPAEDVTEPVKLNAEGMEVKVPAEVINALPAEVTSVAVEFYSPVVDEESNTITFSSVELVDQNGNKIDLEGNTAPIAVTLPAQTGMEGKNVAVFHDGVFVAAAVADANGFISYETTHFCEVTVIEGVAVLDADALANAVKNGGKIVLINDVTIANQLEITSDTAINGMGNTLTYTGASRVINSSNAGIEPDLAISDLSIYCSASYCERGISYNDSGKLTLNNVTVTGKKVNYAINLPSSSDGAIVTINDSDIIGNIALNVWGENTVTVANNTNFRSYYVSDIEACAVIQYNDDTTYSAKGSKLTVNGGSVISDANMDAILVLAKNVTVEVSPETEVVGSLDDVIVASVFYAGYSDFHACGSIEKALELAANNPNATIKLMKDLELTESLVIDGDIVIDLNGYSIIGTVGRDAEGNRIHTIINEGNLTISNGTVASAGNDGGSAIYNEEGATLVLEKDVIVLGAPFSGESGKWPSYGINSYGKLIVNGATFKTYHGGIATGGNGVTVVNDATIDVGQGSTTKQTSWALYTFDNGQLIVNGGLFENTKNENNKVYGGGYICPSSTGETVINGGTFNKTEGDNNGTGIYYNPTNLVIKGGTFDTDPTKYLAEFHSANNNGDGTWTVVSPAAVSNAAELVAALTNGGYVNLANDITLSEVAVIPAGVAVVLDLKGYAISMEESILSTAYAINNLGTLTLKDSVGTGSVNARGIYNGYGNGGENVPSAKLIVESGTYNAKGTNGGAAIFNYGIVEVKGGSFTSIGGYSLNNQLGATMTVEDGVVVNNGIYNSGATLVVNGGNISGNRSGCHVIYAWNAKVTINGGEFYNYNSGNATIMAAGESECTINGGTFGIKDGRIPGNGNTWTSCLTDTQNSATMIVNGGTFNGGFRVQAGTTMTIVDGSFNDCYGSNYNIYGTVTIKGGDFTDDTAKNFAGKYVAEGYELNANGEVVAKG